MVAPPSSPGAIYAGLDLGSNSFRCELARVEGEHYQLLDYQREPVRLGAGLDAQRRLTDEALGTAWACLSRFAPLIRDLPPSRVRVVATQTLREAVNSEVFLARAQAILGVPVDIIGGLEEARLIYLGVNHLQPCAQQRLVVDIGGRSTELVLGEGPTVRASQSLALGSVSVTQQHFGDGQLSAARFEAAVQSALVPLQAVARTWQDHRWTLALGASGTVNAVSQFLLEQGRSDGRISTVHLDELIARVQGMAHMDQLDLPQLRPDRKKALPGGLALLRALFTAFGLQDIFPAKGALRQGVIVDLAQRAAAPGRPT